MAAGTIAVGQYFAASAPRITVAQSQPAAAGARGRCKAADANRDMRITSSGMLLRLFSDRIDPSAPLLVVAPHPDDAETGFGLHANDDASVVTVTAGKAGAAIYRDSIPGLSEMYSSKA